MVEFVYIMIANLIILKVSTSDLKAS